LAAVMHAANITELKYLFIDLISIDQQLQGDKLLQQVVTYATLYGSIPVIAAYTKLGQNLNRTMLRPWIINEARLFANNPNKITYVGHSNLGTEKDFDWMFSRVRRSGFAPTALGVLCGTIGMTSVADFKFIIPSLASIITMAYEKMSRNDYLLTTSILSAVHVPTAMDGYNDIEGLTFNLYRLSRSFESDDYSSSWSLLDIFLGDTMVAF